MSLEKRANLKSEIDDLSTQYQQRLRVFYPWATMDPSLVIGRPAYPFPIPFPIPSAPVPIHPIQPYPFFQKPIPGTILNRCSTCIPCSSSCNPQFEQSSNQHINQNLHTKDARSQISSQQDSRSKPSDHCQRKSGERNDDISVVGTELELKTPGFTVCPQLTSAHFQRGNNPVATERRKELAGDMFLQDLSSKMRKGKEQQHKGNGAPSSSSSSRCSSCCSAPDDNSNCLRDGSVTEN